LAQRRFAIKQWSIVIAPCPFSGKPDKKRPWLVLKRLSGDEIWCCAITSQSSRQDKKVGLYHEDYDGFKLKCSPSYIEPSNVARILVSDIKDHIGDLKEEKISEVVDFVNNMRKLVRDNVVIDVKNEISVNAKDIDKDNGLPIALQRPKKPNP
jgi:mRNA-degrading endonuclease toxin of MazEF toxin-antitoxin module